MATDKNTHSLMRVRLSADEKERYEAAAASEMRTLSSFVRIACEERAARVKPIRPVPHFDDAA